jgi:hypothetical protein
MSRRTTRNKHVIDINDCAYESMPQITGTCWFNSIVNLLFLTPATRECIKIEWDELTISVNVFH